MDTANERGWFIRFEAGCDIENSFVLNLRLNRAVERWLCVIRGTSSIEIEERYRKREKGSGKREMRTGPNRNYPVRMHGMHNFLYMKKIREPWRI